MQAGEKDRRQAAAVPHGVLTALFFVRRGSIQPGEKVLINGAYSSRSQKQSLNGWAANQNIMCPYLPDSERSTLIVRRR